MLLRRRDLGAIVLALTLVGLLAHICVLPLHGHAAEIDSHADHRHTDTGPANDDGGESAIHAASCEALLASSAADLADPSPQSIQAVTFFLGAPDVNRFAAVAPPEPFASPPLYLTHRALLI